MSTVPLLGSMLERCGLLASKLVYHPGDAVEPPLPVCPLDSSPHKVWFSELCHTVPFTVVSHSLSFSLSKACCSVLFQINFLFFRVSRRKGAVNSGYDSSPSLPPRNFALNCTVCKKLLTSLADFGRGHCLIMLHFSGSGDIPSFEDIPKPFNFGHSDLTLVRTKGDASPFKRGESVSYCCLVFFWLGMNKNVVFD